MDKTKKIKIIKMILVISFIILFALYTYISNRAEYLEISEIGEQYLSVFYTNKEYRIKIFLTCFIVLFLVTTIANRDIKKGLKVFFDDEKKEMPKLPNKSIAFILAVIGSGIITSLSFEKTMLFINNTWFGISDPIFGMDLGFFFFQKPFIELVLSYVSALLVLLVIYTAAYYILVFNICLEGIEKELLLKSKFIKTLKVYIMLIAITVEVTHTDNIINKYKNRNKDPSNMHRLFYLSI